MTSHFFFFFLASSVRTVRKTTQEQRDVVLLARVVDRKYNLQHTQARRLASFTHCIESSTAQVRALFTEQFGDVKASEEPAH